MQAYAKPGAGPGDGAPGSEAPAPIKMNTQRTKWGHVMPVRTHSDHRALSPCGRGVHRETASSPFREQSLQ